MAGYSKRSLVEKLGIKDSMRIAIINQPNDYKKDLGKIPDNAAVKKKLSGSLDFIQYFSAGKKDLEAAFSDLKKSIKHNGMLWISWPKLTSGLKTDLNENIVREIGLKNGLVDIKICAVNEIWSGLKFVYRVKDRK